MSSSSQQPPQSSSSSIKNPDMLALKAYIQAQDATAYNALDPDLVVIDVTHSNLQQRYAELRFYKQDTLATLRQRIHRKTGTPPGDQFLQIYDAGDQCVANVLPTTSDATLLGTLGLTQHGLRVHCIDTNPYSGSAGGAYEDTSLVPKFTLSEAAYDARPNTLRAWATAQKQAQPHFDLKQHASNHRALVEAQRAHRLGLALPPGFVLDSAGKVVADEPDVPAVATTTDSESEFGPASVSHILVGNRCQVAPGQRRGTVAYVGLIPELQTQAASNAGWWVGVALDEPRGQNDGTVGGTRYFDTTGPRYGCLVRGKHVEVGDFPEEDFLLEDSDEDEL